MRWPILGLTTLFAAAALAAPQATAPQPATIVLAQKLVAGQPATLSVLSSTGQLVPRTPVQFLGGDSVSTDNTGRAIFTAPSQPGVLIAELPGIASRASATIIVAEPAAPLQLLQAPRVASLNDRIGVSGTGFRGEADGNRVAIGAKAALVLAASPVALVVKTDASVAPGLAQLAVDSRGAETSTTINLIAFQLTTDQPRIAPKKKATVTVRVLGTAEPVEIEVRDQTPGIVRFRRGNVQRLVTSGGELNTAEVEMTGVQTGDFAFSVQLVAPLRGQADTEAARQFLVSAQRVAPQRDVHHIEKLIQRLERNSRDAAKVGDVLEKMLEAQPEGQYRSLLESAREVLLTR